MAVAAKPNESEIIKRQCEVVPERYTNCSGISSARLCVKVFQAVAHAKPPRRKAKIRIK